MADVRFNLENNTVEVMRAIEDAVGAFLLEASAELVSQVARNTRVSTSQTKGSWQAVVDESKGEARVGSPLENAIWEEFGTGEYAIHGDGRKGTWYVPVEKVTGSKKPTFNGEVVVVYGKNGQAFYKTNGKKPTRALQKAFDSKKRAIKRRAEQEFGARLK